MKADSSGAGYAGDTYHEKIAALSVDALGIKHLLESDDVALSATNAVDGLVGQMLIAEKLLSDSDPLRMFGLSRYFGDSAYVFGSPSDSLKAQIEKLTALAAVILWIGFFSTLKDGLNSYVPRVGIGCGNLRIRVLDVDSRTHDLHMGSSMVEAHQIESAQLWVGGALPTEICDDSNRYWVEYSPPTAADYEGPRLCAVNWFQTAIDNADRYPLNKLVDDMSHHASQVRDEKAGLKWHNACEFARLMLEQSTP